MIKNLISLSVIALMAVIALGAYAQNQETKDCVKCFLRSKEDGTQWLQVKNNCPHNATEFIVKVKYQSSKGIIEETHEIPRSTFNENGYWERPFVGTNVSVISITANHPKTSVAEIDCPPDNAPDEVWIRFYKKTAKLNGKTLPFKEYGECSVGIVKCMCFRHQEKTVVGSKLEQVECMIDPQTKTAFMSQATYDVLSGKIAKNVENAVDRALKNEVKNQTRRGNNVRRRR